METFDITTFDSSHLKNVINTNEDPFRCADCSAYLQSADNAVGYLCCGKDLCKECDALIDLKTGPTCPHCLGNRNFGIGTIKKQAKRRHAWAQASLAQAFDSGSFGVNVSSFDAVRWYRKAAAKEHPSSMLNLGRHYANGSGCSRDLKKAEEYVEKARLLDPRYSKKAANLLTTIANLHTKNEDFSQAERILQPLADSANARASHALGLLRVKQERFADANRLFQDAIMQSGRDTLSRYGPLIFALDCCRVLNLWAEARFWFPFASRNSNAGDDWEKQVLEYSRKYLRSLRQTCAECGAGLDTSNRKLCKQCKTYSYCSRECQKKHWNKKDGGHREECMGVLELKGKIADALTS